MIYTELKMAKVAKLLLKVLITFFESRYIKQPRNRYHETSCMLIHEDFSHSFRNGCLIKAPKKVSGFLSPQTPASAFSLFFGAMKRCPIAAKIAGSIGIVLNDFFTKGHEHLPDL